MMQRNDDPQPFRLQQTPVDGKKNLAYSFIDKWEILVNGTVSLPKTWSCSEIIRTIDVSMAMVDAPEYRRFQQTMRTDEWRVERVCF